MRVPCWPPRFDAVRWASSTSSANPEYPAISRSCCWWTKFEELFRFRERAQGKTAITEAQGNEAAAFVELLLQTARQTDRPIFVVITISPTSWATATRISTCPKPSTMASSLPHASRASNSLKSSGGRPRSERGSTRASSIVS